MSFAAVVGHDRPRELLSRALAHSTVHTGYLFSGPQGVGKHLVATAFVRALLCLEGSGAACGVCDSCRFAAAGTHPDLIEVGLVEKKKSIGVDQARELGAWLAQSPALGRRKAVIVDPASELTLEAASALLKTLEEPPPGRLIVLIATRAGALPPTVRSRCQHVSFGALSVDEVAAVLRRHGWPSLSARQAAAFADGSPGAALAKDASLVQETAEAVRTMFEGLEAGERGAALAFAEGTGDVRERAQAALRAIIGFARLAARQKLGDGGVSADAVPALLARLGPEQIGRLLAGALETHRRLEGDRPPNAKLALAVLLSGACGAGARQ